MKQSYTMILWSKPYDEEIDEMTDICYQVLSELKNYGTELSPKYLPAWRKADVKEFVFSKENIKYQLEKNGDRKGGSVFYDLGSRISFFSSLNDGLSCGICDHPFISAVPVLDKVIHNRSAKTQKALSQWLEASSTILSTASIMHRQISSFAGLGTSRT